MPIRVMLADDHAVVRAGYRFLLDQDDDFSIAAETADSDSTYHGFFAHQPDVLVLDLSLPGSGGLTVIRRIITRQPEAKILVFTMHEEVLYAKRALEAGAKGYISKNSDPEILPDAIRRIAQGGSYIIEPIAQQLVMQYTTGEGVENPMLVLTNREFEVFGLATRGLTIHEIAATLHLSQKTVANYITGIKRKLGVNTVAELVRLAYRYHLDGA